MPASSAMTCPCSLSVTSTRPRPRMFSPRSTCPLPNGSNVAANGRQPCRRQRSLSLERDESQLFSRRAARVCRPLRFRAYRLHPLDLAHVAVGGQRATLDVFRIATQPMYPEQVDVGL